MSAIYDSQPITRPDLGTKVGVPSPCLLGGLPCRNKVCAGDDFWYQSIGRFQSLISSGLASADGCLNIHECYERLIYSSIHFYLPFFSSFCSESLRKGNWFCKAFRQHCVFFQPSECLPNRATEFGVKLFVIRVEKREFKRKDKQPDTFFSFLPLSFVRLDLLRESELRRQETKRSYNS